MMRWLALASVQLALGLAAFLAIAWRLGPFAAVIASPLLGAAIARPLMALLANIRHAMRERTWLPVHGQHYVYKGVTVHALEDDDHFRWVPLADLRKVVGLTASERALALAYPGRCVRMGKGNEPHLRDDALITHLGKESNAGALRFRTWAERTIAFPGRRIRDGLGIRDPIQSRPSSEQ
ncbi:MAG: hypothetical protein NVSMB34_09290 [Variovorax sp.]